MRTTVLLTLAVPLAGILIFTALKRFYVPDELPGSYSFVEETHTIPAADGARLNATLTRVIGDGDAGNERGARPLIVFVADRTLDGDWNSRSFSFRSGSTLARIFASAGYHSLRFDHRGTGATVASPRTHLDLELMTGDIAAVINSVPRLFRSPADEVEATYVLAHGDGCALTLQSLQSHARGQVAGLAGLLLTACPIAIGDLNAPQSLFEQWGRILLHNMRRQRVPQNIVSQAAIEWKHYAALGELPVEEIAPAKEPSPDLIAFREALAFMDSAEMQSYRKLARQMHSGRALTALTNAGLPVIHLFGQSDGELPPESYERAQEYARANFSRRAEYRSLVIAGMNHFLKEQDQIETGPGLALERLNPFRRIHPEAVDAMLQFVVTNSPYSAPPSL